MPKNSQQKKRFKMNAADRVTDVPQNSLSLHSDQFPTEMHQELSSQGYLTSQLQKLCYQCQLHKAGSMPRRHQRPEIANSQERGENHRS